MNFVLQMDGMLTIMEWALHKNYVEEKEITEIFKDSFGKLRK